MLIRLYRAIYKEIGFLYILIGTFIIDIVDHPVFVYLTNRQQETSIELRKLIARRQFILAFRFWDQNHRKENKLIIY